MTQKSTDAIDVVAYDFICAHLCNLWSKKCLCDKRWGADKRLKFTDERANPGKCRFIVPDWKTLHRIAVPGDGSESTSSSFGSRTSFPVERALS